MAYDICVFEFGHAVFVVVVCCAIASVLSEGRGRAQRGDLDPGILSRVRIAGDNCVRDKVANLGRCFDLASERGAKQPVADADHLVLKTFG